MNRSFYYIFCALLAFFFLYAFFLSPKLYYKSLCWKCDEDTLSNDKQKKKYEKRLMTYNNTAKYNKSFYAYYFILHNVIAFIAIFILEWEQLDYLLYKKNSPITIKLFLVLCVLLIAIIFIDFLFWTERAYLLNSYSKNIFRGIEIATFSYIVFVLFEKIFPDYFKIPINSNHLMWAYLILFVYLVLELIMGCLNNNSVFSTSTTIMILLPYYNFLMLFILKAYIYAQGLNYLYLKDLIAKIVFSSNHTQSIIKILIITNILFLISSIKIIFVSLRKKKI